MASPHFGAVWGAFECHDLAIVSLAARIGVRASRFQLRLDPLDPTKHRIQLRTIDKLDIASFGKSLSLSGEGPGSHHETLSRPLGGHDAEKFTNDSHADLVRSPVLVHCTNDSSPSLRRTMSTPPSAPSAVSWAV